MNWRIRNLPYPASVYSVTIDGNQIVVRTSNKKYFKRIRIPDLDNIKCELTPTRLSWSHRNNTLVIKYEKPPELLEQEEAARSERAHMTIDEQGNVSTSESPGECKQQ